MGQYLEEFVWVRPLSHRHKFNGLFRKCQFLLSKENLNREYLSYPYTVYEMFLSIPYDANANFLFRYLST